MTRNILITAATGKTGANATTTLLDHPHFVQHILSVAVDYRNGIFAGTNNIVRDLTGAEPLTVEAFIERNKQHFG